MHVHMVFSWQCNYDACTLTERGGLKLEEAWKPTCGTDISNKAYGASK